MTASDLLQLLLACTAAGTLAALLGLGGGVIVVPLLTLWHGETLVHATATSLVCCMATSAGGSVAFDKAKLADFRLVAHLEVFSALGALGASYAGAKQLVPQSLLYAAFALVVGYAAFRMLRRELRRMREERQLTAGGAPNPPAPLEARPERVAEDDPQRNYGLAFALSTLAGVISGLLGIGGGAVKVPLQTEALRLPVRVALANANVMMGITTGFGAAVHLGLGTVDPQLTAPCALGMASGAYLGGRLAPRIRARWLALALVVVLSYVAVRMTGKAWGALG